MLYQIIKYASFLTGMVACCFLDTSDLIINAPTVVASVCFALTIVSELKITIDSDRRETNRRIQERRKQIEKINACDSSSDTCFLKSV